MGRTSLRSKQEPVSNRPQAGDPTKKNQECKLLEWNLPGLPNLLFFATEPQKAKAQATKEGSNLILYTCI